MMASQAEEQRVAEHKHSGAEAVLNRLKVVREIAHEISDLAVLIIALGQLLAVREHPRAHVGLDLDPEPKKQTRQTNRPTTIVRMTNIIGRHILSSRKFMSNASVSPPVLDGAPSLCRL